MSNWIKGELEEAWTWNLVIAHFHCSRPTLVWPQFIEFSRRLIIIVLVIKSVALFFLSRWLAQCWEEQPTLALDVTDDDGDGDINATWEGRLLFGGTWVGGAERKHFSRLDLSICWICKICKIFQLPCPIHMLHCALLLANLDQTLETLRWVGWHCATKHDKQKVSSWLSQRSFARTYSLRQMRIEMRSLFNVDVVTPPTSERSDSTSCQICPCRLAQSKFGRNSFRARLYEKCASYEWGAIIELSWIGSDRIWSDGICLKIALLCRCNWKLQSFSRQLDWVSFLSESRKGKRQGRR